MTDKNQRKLELQAELGKIQSEIHRLTGANTREIWTERWNKLKELYEQLRTLMREHDLLGEKKS